MNHSNKYKSIDNSCFVLLPWKEKVHSKVVPLKYQTVLYQECPNRAGWLSWLLETRYAARPWIFLLCARQAVFGSSCFAIRWVWAETVSVTWLLMSNRRKFKNGKTCECWCKIISSNFNPISHAELFQSFWFDGTDLHVILRVNHGHYKMLIYNLQKKCCFII
jgi:hypothetical protein